MDQQGHEAIIGGIRTEAEARAAQILAEAEAQIRSRDEAWAEQEKSQLRDAQREADKRAEAEKRIAESQYKLEMRRLLLRAREALITHLLNAVQSDIAKKVNDPSYSEVLRGWIVEAGLGLLVDEALVQSSAAEASLIDENLLRGAEETIFSISGRKMKLRFDPATALPAQGVVLVADGGAIAYRNQVPVRMERYQSQIRHLIYERLFKED